MTEAFQRVYRVDDRFVLMGYREHKVTVKSVSKHNVTVVLDETLRNQPKERVIPRSDALVLLRPL